MRLITRLLLLLALTPLAACAAEAPANTALVAGEDYIEIPGGQPWQPLDGKVEVVELFGYTCPHCAHFEPMLENWLPKQPSYVRLTPVPGAFGGPWDAFARAYFAADDLGVAKRSHMAMFQAIHDKHSMPIQNVAPEELATFYADYGVKPDRFIAVLKGDKVEQQVKAARDFALRSHVLGTPSLIVNGRYMVRGKNFDDLLRVTSIMVRQLHDGTFKTH